MADQLAKEGREKEQPPSHLSYREVKTLIHNKKKAIFHCKTEGYNPNQDALHQLICGTHGRKDLVNATIISNVEEEEAASCNIYFQKIAELENDCIDHFIYCLG